MLLLVKTNFELLTNVENDPNITPMHYIEDVSDLVFEPGLRKLLLSPAVGS